MEDITIKTLLVAVNAKYIHTSLAVRSINSYCEENGTKIHTKEFTINNDEDFIINEIFKEKPDLLGISCYIWNIEIVLDIISTLKKILPNLKIFLGGPEASYDYEYFFDVGVDLVCIGEGERTVKEIVDKFNEQQKINLSFMDITGIAFKNGENIIQTENRELLPLDKIPFVYKNGFEDTKNKIIYYEASRGCPYSCQYCLSSLERRLRFLSEDRVVSDLGAFLENKVRQVKFVDRTFNCNKKFAMFIWKFLIDNDNGITNFHFEISADILDDEMMQLLKLARPNLFQFEIGIQSTNDDTLNEVQRKTNIDKLFEKVKQVDNLKNIHQHLDLIAGLPFEDYEIFKKSFNDVFELYPQQFQLGFLKLLKGSGLRINSEKYGIVYKSKAPYEVIYTKLISYEEMCMIKNVEELVETYYNSGKAVSTIKYCLNFFNEPFEFFEKFAEFWVNNELFYISHNKIKLYEIIYDFMKVRDNIKIEFLKDIIRFDILLNDNIKTLPSWLFEFDASIKVLEREFYNNEENIQKYIPYLCEFEPKQLARICYFGEFNFDVELAKNSDFRDIEGKIEYILFDYYKKSDIEFYYHILDIK